MARLSDIYDSLRVYIEGLDCITFDTQPWVEGPPLSARRVAIVSTAGLQSRGDRPFSDDADDYRVIPGSSTAGDIVMSHVSTAFDRTGFQQDINVAFPIDRLRELAAEDRIGSVADFHYSVMGATAPQHMEAAAHELSGHFKADGVDAVLLVPI
ncbi:MAG: glycine/sarcosine/betaine reductase selenoprotein B family protein [Alphaproteobacteria bacterium]